MVGFVPRTPPRAGWTWRSTAVQKVHMHGAESHDPNDQLLHTTLQKSQRLARLRSGSGWFITWSDGRRGLSAILGRERLPSRQGDRQVEYREDGNENVCTSAGDPCPANVHL